MYLQKKTRNRKKTSSQAQARNNLRCLTPSGSGFSRPLPPLPSPGSPVEPEQREWVCEWLWTFRRYCLKAVTLRALVRTVVASGFSVEDPKAVELPKVRDFKRYSEFQISFAGSVSGRASQPNPSKTAQTRMWSVIFNSHVGCPFLMRCLVELGGLPELPSALNSKPHSLTQEDPGLQALSRAELPKYSSTDSKVSRTFQPLSVGSLFWGFKDPTPWIKPRDPESLRQFRLVLGRSPPRPKQPLLPPRSSGHPALPVLVALCGLSCMGRVDNLAEAMYHVTVGFRCHRSSDC